MVGLRCLTIFGLGLNQAVLWHLVGLILQMERPGILIQLLLSTAPSLVCNQSMVHIITLTRIMACSVTKTSRFQMVVLYTQIHMVFSTLSLLIPITVEVETLTAITVEIIETLTTPLLITILQLSQLAVISLIAPAFLEHLLSRKRTSSEISTSA